MPRVDPSLSESEVQWINSQSTGKYKIMESLGERPEKISFWNDAPPFHSSADIDCVTNSANKFVIEKVEIRGQAKILHGARHVAVVSGVFSESEFRAGQRVTVFPCLCCLCNRSRDREDRDMDGSDLDDMSSSTDMDTRVVFHVDDMHNVIVVEDDVLTVTSLCSALECINRPLVNSMVADLSFDYSHPSLILGIVIHEILQTCLMSRQSSFTYVIREAKRIISTKLPLLCSCNISEREMLNEVLKHLKNVIKFLESGLTANSIEHKVYSQHYGLKGSIDCLDATSVIEIKTGKSLRVEHRYQAILYSILMTEQHLRSKSEDYNEILSSIVSSQVNDGMRPWYGKVKKFLPILYYVRSGDFLKIDVDHQEMIHLFKLRNDLACSKDLRVCQCPEDYPCTILNKIKDLGVGHFLRKQLEAIEAEGRHRKTFFKGVKIEQRKERVVYRIQEQLTPGEHICIYSSGCKAICLGIVEAVEDERATILLRESIDLDRIIMISLDSDATFLKFMRWSLIRIAYVRYLKGGEVDSFLLPGQEFGLEHVITDEERCVPCQNPGSSNSLSNLELSNVLESDSFTISSEIFDIGLETGSMEEVQGSTENNNALDSKEHCEDDGMPSISSIEACFSNTDDCGDSGGITDATAPSITMALDRNRSFALTTTRDSDRSLCCGITGQKTRIASSTASSQRPRIAFNHPDLPESLHYFSTDATQQGYRYGIPELFRDDFLKLNDDQKSALFLALNCKNYRIIHGMPGTGKSTLISLLIQIFAHYGLKVLLICYTHMAIENILKKVGDISYYRAKKESISCHTYDSLKKLMMESDLVAGTCYSFGDPIYIGRRFDYCIIDEGSQMHLLLSLIPVSLCDRFCIVGDHLQLKPLAKRSKELSLSLFEYLMEGCSVLTMQYRMGDSIMRLSNTLFYNSKLVGTGKESTVEFIDSTHLDYPHFISSLGKCTILCYFNSKVKEIARHTRNLVTTIDRFQGSESDEVVVVFDPVEKCEVIESRERLNVALTRAKSTLKLIGNRKDMVEIPLFKQLLEIL